MRDAASTVEQFEHHLAACRHDLYRYIFALVPQPADADELFQQTVLALWQHWPEYDPQREFRAWALGYARNHVRNFIRKRMRRGEGQMLSGEVIESLISVREQRDDYWEQVREALDVCMAKLPMPQRNMVLRFYAGELSPGRLAEQLNVSTRTLYRRIAEMRRRLADCIQSVLGAATPWPHTEDSNQG